MSDSIELYAGSTSLECTQQLMREYFHSSSCTSGSSPQENALVSLWIVPSREFAEKLRTSLALYSTSPILTPRIQTFHEVAEDILQEVKRPVIPLSEATKLTLLQDVILRLNQQNQLKWFHSICETKGFLQLVSQFIAELKREEIWPDEFITACNNLNSSITPRNRELGLIYQIWQEQLLKMNRYDHEGYLWMARKILEEKSSRFSDRYTHLFVDGFSSLSTTQNLLLQILSSRMKRLLVSVLEDVQGTSQSGQRSLLFRLSNQQIARLRKFDHNSFSHFRFSNSDESALTQSSSHVSLRTATFQHLAHNLFSNPREGNPLTDAEGIEIVAVMGKRNEIHFLTTRIKRLLARNVPAHQIVVVSRNLESQSDLVRELFSEANIPFQWNCGMPLSRNPLLKMVYSVLQTEREDWSYRSLVNLFDSWYFSPCWSSESLDDDLNAMRISFRNLKLQGNRNEILKTLQERLDYAQSLPNPKAKESFESDARCLEFLTHFQTATEPLRESHRFSEWSQILTSLVEELGFLNRVPQQEDVSESVSSSMEFRPLDDIDEAYLAKRDLIAWNLFLNALEEAERVESDSEEESPRLSLDQFQQRIVTFFSHEQMTFEENQQDAIRICDPFEARNFSPEYLFLCGLTEESFPRLDRSPLHFSDEEREHFENHGITFASPDTAQFQEMFLFYQIVTSPTKQLVMSYPATEKNGEPLFPSPYLNALQELFTDEALPVSHWGTLDPVPDAEEVLTEADLRVTAALQAQEHKPQLLRKLMEREKSSRTVQNILSALKMASARFQTRGFTPWEGRFSNPKVQPCIDQLFHANREYSATGLEQFGTCPFRYFLGSVLNIEQMESNEIATDYRTRGTVTHHILETLHQSDFFSTLTISSTEEDESSQEEYVKQFVDRFQELIRQQLPIRSFDSRLRKTLVEIEQNLLEEWGREYAQQYAFYLQQYAQVWDQPPVPVSFEVGFGSFQSQVSGKQSHPPLMIHADSPANNKLSDVHIQGRIDRIDTGSLEGQLVFNLVDYKTGKGETFTLEDVANGSSIQLALYLLAVVELKLVEEQAVPFQIGYWKLKETGFQNGYKSGRGSKFPKPLPEDFVAELRERLESIVPRQVHEMKNGSFIVHNPDEDCTSRCPYKTCCRVGQIRPLKQSLNKQPTSM